MRRTLLSFFTLVAITSLLLITACSSGGAVKQQATATPIPAAPAATKPTYPVTRGDITAQVQFTARIIPVEQEELFFRTDGRIRKVYVKNGDQVKAGQVLADLLSLDQMEMQAKTQDLTLRRAQINYEMAWLRQQLAATQTANWTPGYEINMKMQQYEVELAQISLEETKLQAEKLDSAITDSQIIAPMDGKVLALSAMEGSEVKAFSTLATVGDDTRLEVGAPLTTEQMEKLAEGMQTVIELPSRPGEKQNGKIRMLPYPYGSGGETKSVGGKTTAVDNNARISLDNPEVMKSFRMGDLVQVTAILESKQQVLWIPPSAVRTFEGRNFVVIKTDGLPRRADVKLGIKNEEKVEIVAGLEEGQIVIAP